MVELSYALSEQVLQNEATAEIKKKENVLFWTRPTQGVKYKNARFVFLPPRSGAWDYQEIMLYISMMVLTSHANVFHCFVAAIVLKS